MNWRKFVVLAFLLGVAACHRKITVNVPPAAPVAAPEAAPVVISAALRDADSAFDGGDFARAAKSYESHLKSNPKGEDTDRILFRYAVAQSKSGVPELEAASSAVFNELVRDYPKSEYVPPANMILSLRADIDRIQADTIRLKADTALVQNGEKVRDERINQLNEELDLSRKDATRLQADIVRLQADQKTRDEKIKQLNEELDKLKKIDSERRRTP